MEVAYPAFTVSLSLDSATALTFDIQEGKFARKETVAIQVEALGNSVFAVSWKEADGATVVNVQDYDRGVVHSFATLPGGEFIRMMGPIVVTRPARAVADDRPARNKALVLDAMTALFQRRDASAVKRLYAPGYVQHNPDIAQGRDALEALVANLSADVYYEPGLMVAEGSFVAIHGRIRGWGPKPQVVVDLFRVEGGKLAEHWDVLQDEVPVGVAAGGTPMFDPDERARQGETLLRAEAAAHVPVDFDAMMQANLHRVFNERDATRRLVAIRALYHEHAELHEPQGSVQGHAAISQAVADLLSHLPTDFRFAPIRPAVGHHDVGRLQWQSGPTGGPAAVTGTDVAIFEGGLIRALYVFLDQAA